MTGLFKAPGYQSPVPPEPEPPKEPMPIADDAAVQEAKKKSILSQRRRKGRKSTVLSD